MKKLLVAWAMLCLPLSAWAVEDFVVVFKTQGNYQDVRDMLEIAIESKGLKITNTNMVANMLERTGEVVGSTKLLYTGGEQMNFCSASISRHMMDADPHAMVLCPYSISVYAMPNDKNVYLAYRKPAATKNPALKKSLMEVEKLLVEIIKDVL